MFTKREVGIALALFIALALIGGGISRQAGSDVRDARHEAAAARAIAQAAETQAASLSDVASERAARAALAEHRADSLAHLPARVRYLTASATAPDTCAALVALADFALAQADGVTVALRQANGELHVALDSTSAALQLVRGSQRQLGVATANLERAAKPSLLSRVLPRPTVGLSAGVDALGRPHVIAGIGLGWSL